MRVARILIFVALMLTSPLRMQGEGTMLSIIPQPRSVEQREGFFAYSDHLAVVCDKSVENYVGSYLQGGFGPVGVAVWCDPRMELPKGGYKLNVTPCGVQLCAPEREGLLNGFHTLLQLFPANVYERKGVGQCLLPCVSITDWPEYSYRGQHLDVARTYMPVDEIEEFISHLAHHKLNVLHLHLTDDEGWRIEIEGHPRLTEVGAWRGPDEPILPIYGKFNEKYGGYYSADELRHLVAYAAERGVTIVPEIDLPGHSLAIGKVYPEVLCPVERDNSARGGYDGRNVWCVAREENYQLLEEILGQVCDIFPSEYIHIGGDEVSSSWWRDCPHCSALYEERNMQSYAELQAYFMERLSDILLGLGRKPAMWNEATDSGTLPTSVRIHGWEGLEECRKVAEAGYPTVVMPGPYFYFDMRQSKSEHGHNWAGVVTAEKCYSVSLRELGYSPQARANVIGFSGAFWSELHVTYRDDYESYVEYQTFPRVCALSEVAWLPEERRSWGDFEPRLERHKARLEAMGVSYRRGAPAPPVGRQITPSMRVTTSLPMSRDNALEKLSAYANDYGYRTTRTCHDGDWILYEFDGALRKGTSVELTTGYRHVVRGIFSEGVVEVSGDGEKFRQVANLHNGGATITLAEPVRAIRLRSTRTANGDGYVFVQYPIIRRPE
ncbi:MAG: beta-N-acetylhexosaminidase [Tidjanibacter sp.]|nr:beta-N-acetylhexosaminidase [Tidjanibacter sp.]